MANVVGNMVRREGGFYGQISTLDTHVEFRMEAIEHTTDDGEVIDDDRAPSHRIVARGTRGNDVEVGAAWRKNFDAHHKKAGQDYYQLRIDDPSLMSALNVSAFQSGQPGEYEIVWNRHTKAA